MFGDWLSPLIAIAQEISNGGGVKFEIPADAGWTGKEVVQLLKRSGIQAWENIMVGNNLCISVPTKDSKAAIRVLRQHRLV